MSPKPTLWSAFPLTAWICWGYAVTNIGLGLGMYFLYRTTIAPISVANILPYKGWGVLFFLTGVVSVYGLLKDDWRITRYTQIAGLFIKAVWAVALIIRCFEAPRTILITMVWLFFAFIQFGIYWFFPTRRDDV